MRTVTDARMAATPSRWRRVLRAVAAGAMIIQPTMTRSRPLLRVAAAGVAGAFLFLGVVLATARAATPRVLVANSADDTVSVIRTVDFTVESTLNVGSLPTDIAVDSASNVAYVANSADGTVSVIRLSDFTVVATVPVGPNPVGVTLSPDASSVYVVNNLGDSISVISTATTSVFDTIDLDPAGTLPPLGPTDVAVTPDGSFLYVTNNSADTVMVIRTSDNVIVDEIAVGLQPQRIGLTVDGSLAYLTQTGDDNVLVIRTSDDAVLGAIGVGDEPTDLTFTPDGDWIFVSCSGSDTITKIRTPSVPADVVTIPVGFSPTGVGVSTNGQHVAVANTGENSVSFVNVVTDQVDQTVVVGTAPFGIGVGAEVVFELAGSATPSPVQPGQQLTYTLTYSNIGPKAAEGVVLSATVPSNASFVSASGSGAFVGGEVQWSVGQLPIGSSGSESFVVAVQSPLAPTALVTTVGALVDADGVFVDEIVSAPVDSTPLYSLTKVDTTDPVPAASILTYTISYANDGSANAIGEGVTITEVYDSNVTFVSSVPPPSAGTDNQWVIGTLPLGASGGIIVTVAVADLLSEGTIIRNEVRLTDLFDNEVVATEKTTIAQSPTLAIGLTDDRDPVTAGNQFTYVISYTNSGNQNATGVQVNAIYSPGITFVSAAPAPDAGTIDSWTIGDLQVGTNGVIIVTARAADVVPNGTILTTQATIGNGTGFAIASETTTVASAPELNVTVSDDPDPAVGGGGTFTYTITYVNGGSDTAPGVSLMASYDPGTAFVSAVPPPNSGTNQWMIGDLPAGGSGTIVVTMTATAPSGTIVTAQMLLQDTLGNASAATESTTLLVQPDLALSVDDSLDPVSAGNSLTYTLRYSNPGNAPTTGTVVTAIYDPNVAFASSVPPPDAGTTTQWTIGSVATGGSGEVNVTVQVASPLALGTTLTTQATVTADGGLLATASENTLVESEPVLMISKVDAVDPVSPASTLVYTITYGNTGNNNTTGVVVTEIYDPLLTFVSAVPAPDAGTSNQWTIGTLNSGAGGTITVTVAVPAVADGTPLTNQVTITDAQDRTAVATEATTISSTIFSLALGDDVDPAESGQQLEFSISYANIMATPQTGVVVTAAYDPRFVVDLATPAADGGTNNVWTLGTLTAGQAGGIVVRGHFVTQTDASMARTDVQISSANGTAYASETTELTPQPTLERERLMLKLAPNKDRWRAGNRFTVSSAFDPTGKEISVAIEDPSGAGHITELVVPELQPSPRGRWLFKGDVAGNGTCAVRLKARSEGIHWRFKAACKGPGILPPFLPDRTFQVTLRVGTEVFVGQRPVFRESAAGNTRRYP